MNETYFLSTDAQAAEAQSQLSQKQYFLTVAIAMGENTSALSAQVADLEAKYRTLAALRDTYTSRRSLPLRLFWPAADETRTYYANLKAYYLAAVAEIQNLLSKAENEKSTQEYLLSVARRYNNTVGASRALAAIASAKVRIADYTAEINSLQAKQNAVPVC